MAAEGRGPAVLQQLQLGAPSDELAHARQGTEAGRFPTDQPVRLADGSAEGPCRDEFETSLEEGHGDPTDDRGVRFGSLHECVQNHRRLAFGGLVYLGSIIDLPDRVRARMYGYLDWRYLGILVTRALHGLENRHRSVGGPPRGILDGLEPKRGVWPSSSTRPPKVWILSTSSSSARLVSGGSSSASGAVKLARSKVIRRRCQRIGGRVVRSGGRGATALTGTRTASGAVLGAVGESA